MKTPSLTGLYIHIPFCTARCYYCDFVVKPLQASQVKRFWQSLMLEIQRAAPQWRNFQFSSLFFGGGTPSAVAAEDLVLLIQFLRRHFRFTDNVEVTMESNPETLDRHKLNQLRQAGVNRLSIGLQAWQDELLVSLGRRHRLADFLNAFHEARLAGFTNINVDLMYGLPKQSLQEWRQTLEGVLDLSPDHVSAYGLQVEKGTPFDRWLQQGKISIPDEELQLEMFDEVRNQLRQSGYEHYEISNFSLPGHASLHNLTYWLHQPYLGLGPGAYSYRSGVRWRNLDRLRLYNIRLAEDHLPLAGEERLNRAQQMTEFIFLRLRLLEQGVSEEIFRQKFGITLEQAYPGTIDPLLKDDWLRRSEGRIYLTDKALPLANWVSAHFVS